MDMLAERFVLEREIGSGGMARVYLGRDEVLDRPVAVKVLQSGRAGTDVAARFRREGRTAARLSHPNIVQVYDAGEGELDGRAASYIVMEYLPGGDLKGLVDREGPLPVGRLAPLVADVAAGLAHAHGRGVVHRDVKPHNVLLDASGRPKLTDFGIARALDATQATRTGHYLGTALYSSPEQLRGRGVTEKSDVYSLGVMLYQAATGNVPFAGTPIEVASQHVSAAPPPPSAFLSDLDPGLEEIILECLEKEPDRRPTADEVRERLLNVSAARLVAPAPPPPPPPKRSTRVSPPSGRASGGKPAGGGPGVGRTGGAGRGGRRRGRLPALLAAVALFVLVGGAAVMSLDGPWGSAQNPFDNGEQAEAPQEAQEQNAGDDSAQNGQPAREEQQAASEDGAAQSEAEQPGAGAANPGGGQQNQSQGGKPSVQVSDRSPEAQRPAPGSEGQQASEGESQQPAPEPRPAPEPQEQSEEQPSPQPEEQPEPQADEGAAGATGASPEAAEETVREFYDSAAAGDYDTTASLMTDEYRASTFPGNSIENTFDTLESIEYVEGPSAEVNGETATVYLSTVATHTDRVDRPSGTLTLVLVDGEWRIDRINVG